MNNSGNQIRNKMIQSHPKTDRQKLVGIRDEVFAKHPCISITLEPYLLFTKGEDKYEGWHNDLREDQVRDYLVHPTDIVFRFRHKGKNREIFFELDGPIHDVKTEKTAERDRRYELNGMEYFVINENELKLKLGVPKSRPLTQQEINDEFMDRFNKLLV